MESSHLSVYRNLFKGNRLRLFSGIDPKEYPPTKWGASYTYAEFGIESAQTVEGQKRVKLKAGETYLLSPSCGSLKPNKAYKTIIEIAPEFLAMGLIQAPHIVEPEDEGEIVIRFVPDKDVSVKDIKSAIRIYQQQ